MALGFLAGIFMLVQFFVPHESSQAAYELLLEWARIIGAFAFVLGIGSLFRNHLDKIRRRRKDAGYSIVTLVAFFTMVIIGIFVPTAEQQSVRGAVLDVDTGTSFQWLFDNVQVPLDATMFGLLAFFIASAAYRTFRARNFEAGLLLVTAVIIMLARVPIGEMIHAKLPNLYEWIMQYPAVAGKRGIIFGAALGSIATSLRIILGIERSHLGG